jgi:hybrid polyketide synthase/nonribosomal peptide synthetase ACE1
MLIPLAALVLKLQVALQASPDLDVISQSADSLGIDSLVAVDLRSWFLKELNVDMPVLKIISGATMTELLERAQEVLDPLLTPNLGSESESAATEKKTIREKPKSHTQSAITAVEQAPKKALHIENLSDATKSMSTTFMRDPISTILKRDPVLRVATPRTLQNNVAPASAMMNTEAKNMVTTKSQIHAADIPNIHDPSRNDQSPAYSVLSFSSTTPAPESLSGSKHPTSSISSSSFEEISKPSGAESGVQRVLPMSFSQVRFWFLRSYLEDQTAFNITTSIKLNGNLNSDKLAQAVATIGQRHESLRTRFLTNEHSEPMQAVMESSVLRLERKQISSSDEIANHYTQLKNHVFDLENGETLRIILLSQAPNIHQILLGYHHINMDGVSFEIFFKELQDAYTSSLSIDSQVLQYPDFASRQRKEYLDGKWTSYLTYWRKQFPDIPAPLPLLPLSSLRSRLPLTKYESHIIPHRVSSELSSQINDTCKKMKVSAFQFYLTVFRVMIARFVEIEDFCIGVADANRNDSDVQQSLGCYLNLLPIRFDTRTANTFSEAVKDTKSRAQQAYSNSKVPFDVLLSELNVPRSSSQSPLFQIFLNYRQGVAEARTFCDCDCQWTDFDGGQIAYDLSMDVVDNAGGDALLRLSVQTGLYTATDGEILMRSFVNLLQSFSRNPATRLTKPLLWAKKDTENASTLGCGKCLLIYLETFRFTH